MMLMVKHWHRFSKKVVDAPSLETLKVSSMECEHPDLAEGVLAHCREVGLGDI